MRLNFFLWLAGMKLAEAFQWIFSSRTGFRLTLCASAAVLAASLCLSFLHVSEKMPKDSAEHMHVVYALERGEVPFLDFPQNHPTLFHLLALQLKQLFHVTDVTSAYFLTKAFIYLHSIAFLLLIICVLRRLCAREFGDARNGLILIAVLAVMGYWSGGGTWHIRLDRVAHFYAYLAVISHLLMMQKIIQGKRCAGWLLLGAASCGFGAAILSKVIYVIVPYMMTLCLAALASPGYWLKTLSGKLSRLFRMNIVFVALSFLFFAGFVAYELRATGAGLMDYIHSAYTLNSERFILYTDLDTNPFAKIRSILNLPMPLVYILMLSWFPLLLMLHERRKHLFKYALLFIGLTILFNASFPAYSNGVTWGYYFIPSAVAIKLYVAIAIICLLHYVAPVLQTADRSRERLNARQGLAAFYLALAVIMLSSMAAHRVLGTGRMALKSYDAAQKLMGSDEAYFATERLMPSELRYWKLGWELQPIAAPAWGHFIQFRDMRGFWRKMHKLGLSPDPVTHWRLEYEKSPPEAIGVASFHQLKRHARQIKDMQYIDIGWLLERVRKEYSCISRGRPFYVRNDLAPEYLQKGYAPCEG